MPALRLRAAYTVHVLPRVHVLLDHPGVARLGTLLRDADEARDNLLVDPQAHLG